MAPQVFVILGSDNDLPAMKPTMELLIRFQIPFEITVSSAHRSPRRTRTLVVEAEKNGVKVFIAAAGGAAHLAGVVAAETTLPVIGVPLDSSPLQGMDSLLSTAQMPPGIPVAAMAVGKWGAANAAVLAAQILALHDEQLRARLVEYKKEMAAGVERKAADLKQSLEK
jgi:phosphoribosylaminoimidazole carboxylase PurE protein